MALWAILAGACSGPARRPAAGVPGAERWEQALRGRAEVVVAQWPETVGGFPKAPGTTLLVSVDGWRVPDLSLTDPQRAGLQKFVADGGRLLLFGYAAALAAELGFETERPESEPFRWGFDARTAEGRARLGLAVVSGRAPELFEGLQPAWAEHTFLLAGGEPCSVPRCAWTIGEPQKGEVLARLAVETDGQPAAAMAPVLVRWRAGAGEVLACGILPAFDGEVPELADNARRFVQNCARRGDAGATGPVVLLPLPPAPVAVPEALPATFAERELPMQPLLAHWGWHAPLRNGDDGGVRPMAELLEEVLLPSWLAGADLLQVDIASAAHGAVLPWGARDPLKRPAAYRSDDAGGWPAAAFEALAHEAHARGMLLQAAIDPLPVGGGSAERLAMLRFFARELACVRRLGLGALDGFAVRDWLPDSGGYGQAMLQDFQPAAFLCRSGENVPEAAGMLRALDADDGALPGLAATGLSAAFRDGFPADRFPLGVLDARAVRAMGAPLGGGSHPDWIVTQANDFVRARRGLGAALWWRAHDPATLGRRTIEYVHGVSQEPLRAAVAMRLSATGQDGQRAASAALFDRVQQGFGAETAAPAAVHALQNNWFRLLGSGGALLFDPQGLAQFRAGEALVVSPAFLHTRLFGGRPDANVVRSDVIDLLQAGQRPAGGHGRSVVVDGTRAADRQLPEQLAFGETPQWPEQAAVELRAPVGYHELQIAPRALRGRGVLVVALDGAVLHCAPFAEGRRSPEIVVPLHLAKTGGRTLQFTVVEGGAVAFDRLRIVRVGDVGAEAQVDVPAGSLAQLGERSASSYHAEQVDLRTIADFPGFLMRLRCERAVRNLQVERTLQLPGHGELLASSGGEGPSRLRGPFVLRGKDAAGPDLVVVPLQLPRYDHFTLRDGTLRFVSAPEAGAEARIGFLLAPRRDSDALRAAGPAIFGALDLIHEIDLGDRGEVTLVDDLGVPWTRVLHLRQRASTPYAVCENGWWTWRGAQPAATGGDWLRICLLPRQAVQVVGGASLLARTRPGPGSLSTIALRDPQPDSVTVRVLQPGRLAPPSVVMATDFDEVFVDGRPWAAFTARTVLLPDRPGTYRIETRSHGGGTAPHVTSTRAPLRRCEYAPASRELVLVVESDPLRPVEQPFTAVLAGPLPSSIENGEVVDDATLRFLDADARAAAAAGGVLIRFRSGVIRVHYGKQ